MPVSGTASTVYRTINRAKQMKEGVSVTTGGDGNVIKAEDLEVADTQLSSLLSKCEAVLRGRRSVLRGRP